MDAAVVVCVDLLANPAAVAGVPCSSGQGLVVVNAVLSTSGTAYDGLQAAGFFSYGFGVVIFAWLLGIAVSTVRKPIRQGS